jgi:glycosyltransferase involved in cell wall biosynthesis
MSDVATLQKPDATTSAASTATRCCFVVIATHPIQYYAPLYRALAASPGIELHVVFCSRAGLETYFDAGFGREFHWKNDLTSGYPHSFLDDATAASSHDIERLDNPSVDRALDALRPDCVMIQGYSTRTMRRALAWSHRRRIPVLLFADSAYPDGVGFPKSVVKKVVLSHLYRRVAGFFSMGDRGRAYHLHYGAREEQVYFCPYTIDEPLFARSRNTRAALRAELRQELGFHESDAVFLFCGKLIERKRPADLVRAAAALLRSTQGQRAVLLFCGDGDLRGSLEALVAEHGVRAAFLGFRNMDTIGEVYCAADAIVLPSEREAYGVVLAEAAFFDLPLIVSDAVGAVGPTSLAREGDNAAVFPVGRVEALAAGMKRLLDPAVRAQMGRRSRAIYELQATAVGAENMVTAVKDVVSRSRNGL